MGTINFEHGILFHGRQNNMGAFDAEINDLVCNQTTNADLTLYVRIYFQQINPTATSNTYNDSDGTAVPIRNWQAAEWANWKRRFLTDCQRKWHGKFWLQTPTTYNGLNWPLPNATHRCNLYCRFEITEQSTANGAHAVIPVVRVNGNHFFRSHMLLYSDRDLNAERLTRGSLFYTHIHEIGHLIGLDHPGTGLPGCTDGSESVCYAAADGTDQGVMGRGSRIYSRHAAPWQKAGALLTSTRESDWTVSMTRAYPRRI
jgi:hypothetical protein